MKSPKIDNSAARQAEEEARRRREEEERRLAIARTRLARGAIGLRSVLSEGPQGFLK